jgi:hypothetical protein
MNKPPCDPKKDKNCPKTQDQQNPSKIPHQVGTMREGLTPVKGGISDMIHGLRGY